MANSKEQLNIENDIGNNIENPESESEYEDIDLTGNPMYQVLSSLFENEKGDNIVEVLEKLVIAVNNNTEVLKGVKKL
jgi:hypothetical protein